LTALLGLFLNNLLPVFLIAGSGYLLGRAGKVNPRSLSQVIFYVFSPSLIFTLITDNRLSGQDLLQMAGFAAICLILTGVVALGLGKALGLERRLLMAVLLTTMFMNAGNIGLPVNLFAFGEDAVALATIFFVTNSVFAYTLGVLIASSGKTDLGRAFLGLFKLPMIYALLLALAFLLAGWKLPIPLDRAVHLLAGASIPSMLILLGLQLQHANWKTDRLALGLSTGVRLLVSPMIALGLCALLGLQGPVRQAGVLESAMPTAVLTTVRATEYDAQPSFVTSAVFISTLLSPLTLTPLMALLNG
jgi:malate permease and related proteins